MESYIQTVAPTIEPITLEDALRHCRVIETDDYTYVRDLISRARRYVERRLERQLITATWRLYLDSFPDEIILRKPPILTVSSIQYTDLNAATQTLTAVTHYATAIVGPDTPAIITNAYGTAWPATYSAYDAVRVTFTAGYGATAASVPETIRHAILLLVQHWFENRESVNVGNIVNEIPLAFESLIGCESWGAYS